MGAFIKSHSAMAAAFTDLLNLFLTSTCALCDRASSGGICPSCCRQLEQSSLPEPLQNLSSPLPVLAWGQYEGSLRQALALLKYSRKPALAQALGIHLGRSWQQHSSAMLRSRRPNFSPGAQPVVVPIPLHPDRQQQRGFNQAELLARGFCRFSGLSLAADGLVRVRATQAQHGLGAQARQRNLAGAFALGPAFQTARPTGPVLLLDDIYTTGATAQAAAAALRRHGIAVVGMGAVARAMPSGGSLRSL